jgi:hypothetical protein
MPTSIKAISTATLESAITTAIANLIAQDCSLSITELKYDFNPLISTQSFSFSVEASCSPKKSEDNLPF